MTDDIIRKTFAGCLVLEKIGQGGMGVVYKAHHIKLNKVVCIKILPKELEADPRNIDFFLREAEISKQLDHPNTVHVYDFGKEMDKYYIIMSFVEGKSLEFIVKEKGSLDIKEASEIMLGIMRGLEHAHSKNIIHRDIKPSNIIITKDGIPRIIDFGLARRVTEEKQLTITGEMIGTAYFISPEQALGNKVDSRTDLYSAGATFFYMLTGRYPFEGNSAIEVINKHIYSAIPNLYMLKPDLPIWAIRMIEKLMKKNPDERYQTATEVIKELEEYKKYDYKNIILSENTREIIIEGISEKEEQPKESSKKNYQNNQNILHREEKPEDYEILQQSKLQNTKLALLTRFFFHLFLTFATLITIIFYGYAQKNIVLLSYFILGILVLLTFHTAKRGNKLKEYIFPYILVLVSSYEFATNSSFKAFNDYLYKILETSEFKLKSIPLIFLSVFFLQTISSYFNSTKQKIFFYFINIFLIITSALHIEEIFNINTSDTHKLLFIAAYLMIATLGVKYKKNLFLLLYLFSLSVTIPFYQKIYIEKNIEPKYNEELEEYNKKVKEIEIQTREELYFKLKKELYSKLEEYDFLTPELENKIKAEVENRINEEIKNRISKIELPNKEKIRVKLNSDFYEMFKSNLRDEFKKSIFSISLFTFVMLNLTLIIGLKKKNET